MTDKVEGARPRLANCLAGISHPSGGLASRHSGVPTVYLIYHQLEIPGRRIREEFSGHRSYVVRESEFRMQMSFLRERDWRGMSVSEAFSDSTPESPGVVITFDDGSESDLLAAAPVLKEAGFSATFFIVAGWLGRPGYLSASQLRELAGQGFEIGCHSMGHRFLTELREEELSIEMGAAKEELEQILGSRVDHFSCPGSFWNQRVVAAARTFGYHSMVTSKIGVNNEHSDPYCLARVCMMRATTLPDFDLICRGKGLFRLRAKEAILSFPKKVLGADVYVKVHSLLHGQ